MFQGLYNFNFNFDSYKLELQNPTHLKILEFFSWTLQNKIFKIEKGKRVEYLTLRLMKLNSENKNK